MKNVLLFPVTLVLTILWKLRKIIYSFKTPKILKTPVVSIGNLSFGGTGKTPLVDFLLNHFQVQYKIGVLSRGYGGDALKTPTEVELHNDRFYGDEILWLKQRHPQTSMAVFSKRFEAGRLLEEKNGPLNKPFDFFILDDGFQHWDLHRQLDFVLIDASSGFSDLAFFPVGRGREPLAALKRAHGFLITKVNWASENELRYIVHILKLRFPLIPIYLFTYERAGYIDSGISFFNSELAPVDNTVASNLDLGFKENQPKKYLQKNLSRAGFYENLSEIGLQKAKWVAISGIAKPLKFEEMLKKDGLNIVKHFLFKDHFNFSLPDIKKIITEITSHGAKCVMTTEKDLVRLSRYLPLFKESDLRVFAVAMKVESNSEMKGFYEQINSILR